MPTPICDEHQMFMEPGRQGFYCLRCLGVPRRPYLECHDEEADVNDYNEHIYPQLHGTGGIGPGRWNRHGLAEAQEGVATLRKAIALEIRDHFLHEIPPSLTTLQRWADILDP